MPKVKSIWSLITLGRLLVFGMLFVAFLNTLASALTPLPTTTICFDSNRTGNFEIFTMNNDGTNQVQITGDTTYDSWWCKPSPDRTKILFVRTPKGTHDTDYTKVTTWMMNADGTGLTQILSLNQYGWTIQGHPEWKPDQTLIATVGGVSTNAQIYTIHPDGTNPVLITNNGSGGPRGGTNVDPSWRPDGLGMLFIGCPRSACTASSYEVYKMSPSGTNLVRLTNDRLTDNDPYYAPASAPIAWLRNTGNLRYGIYKMNADGTNQIAVIDDGGINSKPGWSLDSATIYFHRIPPNAPNGTVFNIWKIKPDGTGLTELILPRPTYVNEYPVNGIN